MYMQTLLLKHTARHTSYVGIFTPGHAYVYADIVIETHGTPYARPK